MTLSLVLPAHTGCVNSLAWSEHGNLLAGWLAGSDDLHLAIWRYVPGSSLQPAAINTLAT
ncbi:hypothetical protein BC831DRAFT_453276, partial [Entophlyctis helioformis]